MLVAEMACALFFIVTFTVRSSRSIIAGLLFLEFFAHLIIADYATYLSGFIYYSTSALFDAVVIAILISIENKTRLIVDICRLLLCSIIINFMGWLIYELGFNPNPYNLSMAVIYVTLAVRILVTTRRDRGDIRPKSGIWYTLVRRRYFEG